MTNERARRIVDLASGETDPGPTDVVDEITDDVVTTGDTPLADLEAADPDLDHSDAAAEAQPSVIDGPDAVAEEPELTAPDPGPAAGAESAVPEAMPSLESDQPSAEDAVAAGEPDETEPDDDELAAETIESLPRVLEALLFVADEPVAPSALARALGLTPTQIRRGLSDLSDALRDGARGVRLQEGPDGAQLVTAPDVATTVEHFLGLEASRRLSNAALETLAIIAYRQPVTRHAIDQIRGVNSDGAIATLRARALIEGIGRAPGPGRPLLFSTTQRFLEHFGLERPDDLPPLPADLEPSPEAQLALEGAITDEVAASEGGADADEAADEVGFRDQVSVAALDDDGDADLEDDVTEEIELDGDLDLEISDDLSDLSRAAGMALAVATEASDGEAID